MSRDTLQSEWLPKVKYPIYNLWEVIKKIPRQATEWDHEILHLIITREEEKVHVRVEATSGAIIGLENKDHPFADPYQLKSIGISCLRPLNVDIPYALWKKESLGSDQRRGHRHKMRLPGMAVEEEI